MFWFLLSWAHSSNCLPIKGEVYTFWDGTLVVMPRGTLCCHQTLKSLEPQKANRKQREISQPERPDRYFSYHYVAKKHYNIGFSEYSSYCWKKTGLAAQISLVCSWFTVEVAPLKEFRIDFFIDSQPFPQASQQICT